LCPAAGTSFGTACAASRHASAAGCSGPLNLGDTELDATHPTLPARTAFVQGLPQAPAQVVLSGSENARIDDELARLDGPIQRALINRD